MTQFLKDSGQSINKLENKPILVARAYPILVEKHFISEYNQPLIQQLIDAAVLLQSAQDADNNFNALNLGSDNEEIYDDNSDDNSSDDDI